MCRHCSWLDLVFLAECCNRGLDERMIGVFIQRKIMRNYFLSYLVALYSMIVEG